MGVGKSDLKALAQFKPGGGGGGSKDWYSPAPGPSGDRLIKGRVCPPYTEELKIPFVFNTVHYFDNAGENGRGLNGTCPRIGGGTCLACDFYWGVQGDIPKGQTDLKEAIRNIKQNDRMYCNWLDRETGIIQVWSMPYGLAKNIGMHFNVAADDDLDLSDPVKGHDLIIPVEASGRSYRFGNVAVARRATQLKVPGWEDMLHDLEALAHNRDLTEEEVETAVPLALGEFYDPLWAMYKPTKGKPTRQAKTPPAGKGKKSKSRGRKV